MNFVKRLEKAILLSLMFFMICTTAVKSISADDETNDDPTEYPTIADYAYSSSIITSMLYQYSFDKSKYDEDNSDIPTSYTVDPENTTRTAYFPESVTMKGTNDNKPISLKIEITYLGENRFTTAGNAAVARGEKRGIMRDSENNIYLGAFNLDYRITYTFYSDKNFTNKLNVYAAIAFNDPDQANYKFDDANQRILFYKDVSNITSTGGSGSLRLKNFYYVKDNGLFHIYNDDPDLAYPYLSWPNFNEGTFGVLLNNESTFTYIVEGKQDVLNLFSMVVMVKAPYTVEYYYEEAGEYPETPFKTDTREAEIYKCPIDDDGNPLVSVNNTDKTPEKEGYTLDTSKSSSWEKVLNSDGTTVLKVYFNLPYKIVYSGNAPDATDPTEGMTDSIFSMYDETMDSKENWTFVRPGYDFDGFTYETPTPTPGVPNLHGSINYKNELLADEDRTITLYAQWLPKEYHILYDKNADDATDPTDSMKPNDYTGADSAMPSRENWTFVRPGYAFDGFTFDSPDSTLPRFYGKQEYKPTLLEDEDGIITLYAQWKVAYTIKYDPNGGSGTMTDDVYTVPTDSMSSKEDWTFSRPGYRFVGFKLENDGPTLRGAKDYNEVLVAEEDRTITLYAQWERNIIPLTGIE